MISKDLLGRDKEIEIEDKQQNHEEELEIYCEVCQELLTEEDFDHERSRNAYRAVACYNCDESGIHLSCMNTT